MSHLIPPINRRTLLKGATLTTVAAATPEALQVVAQPRTPPQDDVGLPEPAPLEVIVMNRLAFGARPGDYAAFRALGPDDESRLLAYIEPQLHPHTLDDSTCEGHIAAREFESLTLTPAEVWQRYGLSLEWGVRIWPLLETIDATFLRAVYSRRQLQEVLADFWHNHFNVYGEHYVVAPVFGLYDRDVIRPHIFGNFRQMLEAVAKSIAMLFYLNNESNTNSGPNENYARELFELHALGAENYFGVMPQDQVPTDSDGRPLGYVDEDVYEAARCFTGWTVDRVVGTFTYRSERHDRFQKWVLGTRIPSDQAPLMDGRQVLDLLAAHPGTGRYIARKLCRRLISDDPPERIVNEAAALFTAQVATPDQLRQVVRTIVLSPEFRTTWGAKVKRHFEVMAGVLRGTDALFNASNMWYYKDWGGQKLFLWPAPNGYPDRQEDWTGTMPMLQRWNITNQAMLGAGGLVQPNILTHSPPVASSNQLADLWIALILGRPMSATDRQDLVNFMANGRSGDYPYELSVAENATRLTHMVGLLFLSPDFQWR